MQLTQAAVCTATAWRSYRRPRLALATLVACTAESVWVARRCWRRQAVLDPVVSYVDIGSGIAALLALGAATTMEDRTTWVNWACPLTYSSASGTALTLSRPRAAAATSMFAVTYLATCWPVFAQADSTASTAIANILSYPGYMVTTDAFCRRLRRSATELEEARRTALENGERLATEHERNQQHRLLHDSALQSLELIGRGSLTGTDSRDEASRAAAVLRRALRGQPANQDDNMFDMFESIVLEFAQRGLVVELVTDAQTASAPPALGSVAMTAIGEATREALANVAKHSGQPRAVVNLSSDSTTIEITVRDHGVGFDADHCETGFGLNQSIRGRIDDVGGETTVWSRPGRGTRVSLRLPR